MSSDRLTPLPSPVESVDSLESTVAAPPPETATEPTSPRPDRPEDVMITLSLPPQPLASSRPRSPLARSHFRSRSLAEVPGIPPMTRAYSSPGLDSRGRYIFVNGRGTPTSNPIENHGAKSQPLLQGALESKMAQLNVSETIAEDAEPHSAIKSPSSSLSDMEADSRAASPAMPAHHTLPRMGRRRPSPLHVQLGGSGSQTMSPSAHSPVMLGSKYNESFPTYSSSSSSMPSTPTSLRSRSPSISSLETIPDIPDAEAADEADQIAALKAAAERAEEETSGAGNRRRGTSDASGPASFMGSRFGSGAYGARADKRKRWSVCGAERRQDLDLETIWED